jgi:uncharacterized protein YfaS (alpha-2-macroglobulin family)
MLKRNKLALGGLACAAIVCAVAAGWYAGRNPDTPKTAGTAPAAAAPPAVLQPAPKPSPQPLPSSATVGTADPFQALVCQPRQYNDALSLAVTFNQPVDRNADLQQFLQVIDAGAAPKRDSDENSGQAADASSPVQLGEPTAKGATLKGNWVVGDNPRVVYFPYIKAARRYAVRLNAKLPGADRSTLGSSGSCTVDTNAMAPSFYFASRGVVLPAGQNGGLPVATVNVPEVDVQFLRVSPSNMPELFESVLGVKAPAVKDVSPDADDADATPDNSCDGCEGDEGDWGSGAHTLQGQAPGYNLDRLKSVSTSVYQGRFVTDDKADRRHVTFLPVETIKELQEPGIYVAVMSQPGRFRYEYQVTYFYVSDIGLHARRYADRIEAFTVSLKGGVAITDTKVELIDSAGKSLAAAQADGQGHVRFEGSFDDARLLRATRGKEMTVLALGEPALDLSEYDAGGYPSRDNNLFVYSGRNLYRPGESFKVSVLPRNADGVELKASPLTATLKRADGKTVRSVLWSPASDNSGYIEHAIDLPPDAQTGSWLLELRVDPGQRVPDASWKFQVEEFLPERMKLALTSKADNVAPGEDWPVSVQGDYLYGAPAAGNRLLSNVQVRREKVALPVQWPGFIFGDIDDDKKHPAQQLPDAELDDKGHVQIDVPPGVENAHSPMKVRLSASLLESGGRPVVRSIDRIVWPAASLIGVRPLFDGDVTREGSQPGFEAVRVNAQGELVPLASAQMRLYKEDRQYYWRFDDQRGWNSGYTDDEELVDSRVISLTGRAQFSLPVQWGRYRLEITDSETGQVMRYRFYAGWDAQDAEAVGNRPDRVQMKLAGTPAHPGDKVQLTLTPPHDGQALVTVEGDRMLWSTWVAAKATGTTVEIPIDPSWKRHDLYVSATVFRPGSEGDRITPARAIGLLYLPLDSAGRQLPVKLTAPAKIEPETEALVRVKVDGEAGKTATVTVSAVDVGILNINQYKTPDPFDFFFGKHRYGPELLDMYGKLIEKMAGTQGRLKWGGDAAARGNTRSLPKKVKLVDLFSGPVKVGADGYADVRFKVPDFNGTLRLMAVAFTPDRFGSADAEMVVAAPIVAELNTPRFITPGDQAAIALDVTNLSGATQTIKVGLQALDPLSITDGTRTVTLKNQQRVTLRFTATPTGSYGLAPIRLTLDGSGGPEPLHIERESVLQVQPAYAAERQIRRARVAPGASFTPPASWIAGYFPDSTTIGMTVSNRPPFNVKRLVAGLLSYPYGCTEQTVSAAMPWVVLDADAAKRFGIKVSPQADRTARVDDALARLSGMRSGSGAYSLWGGVSSSDIWLTAYATSFMQDARDRGFTVPEASLERTRQWLLAQVQQSANGFGTWSRNVSEALAAGRIPPDSVNTLRDDHRRFAGLAAASLVLARDKQAPLSTVRQLFDNYGERARSPLPLVQLAAAFKLMGDEARSQRALDAAMQRPYGLRSMDPSYSYAYDEWMGDYGSGVRDYALSYALIAQYGLKHERADTLLTTLATYLGTRSYYSTQEQMALLLAAKAADVVATGGAWEASVLLAGKTAVWQGKTDRSEAIAPVDLPLAQLTNTGAQPLYVEYDIQGSPTVAPARKNDAIRLKRGWYKPNGSPWDGGLLQTGDMLVVWVQAGSSQRIPDALVVDGVPAGFEVENLNLSQSTDMADMVIGDIRVADAMANTNIKHREFRDDRYVAAVSLGYGNVDLFYLLRVVTPGRYSVPSTVAEDMYRPELRGVGEKWGTVEVRDRVAGKR